MPPNYSELFEYLILGSKFVTLVVFVLLALFNRETRYICKNPELFLKDALLLGGSSALSVVFIAMIRTQTVPYEGVFTTFLLFFMYSIVRELSGYFPLLKNENLTPREKQIKKNQPLVYVVGGVVVLLVVFLAYRSSVFPNVNTYAYFSGHVYTTFLLETSLTTMVTFGIAHVLFQMGGFYSIFFPPLVKTFSRGNGYSNGFGWQL